MHIQPTQTDLRKGKAESPDTCPIARAARRAYRKTFNSPAPPIFIGLTELTIVYGKDNSKDFPLPATAREFIEHFDGIKPYRAAIRKNYRSRDSGRVMVEIGFNIPVLKKEEPRLSIST